mmetsp:Transcript_22975/g.74073  ORF Transcript_22975/g.74073 Transcript_22975/m.74073 type:complete len:254 (+) Transcript_22975:703-1464(+)
MAQEDGARLPHPALFASLQRAGPRAAVGARGRLARRHRASVRRAGRPGHLLRHLGAPPLRAALRRPSRRELHCPRPPHPRRQLGGALLAAVQLARGVDARRRRPHARLLAAPKGGRPGVLPPLGRGRAGRDGVAGAVRRESVPRRLPLQRRGGEPPGHGALHRQSPGLLHDAGLLQAGGNLLSAWLCGEQQPLPLSRLRLLPLRERRAAHSVAPATILLACGAASWHRESGRAAPSRLAARPTLVEALAPGEP